MAVMHRLFSRIEGVFSGDDPIDHPGLDLTFKQNNLVNVINFVFLVAGLIAVMMIIIGGFWYVTSGGEPQKTKKAKDTILYAVGGLVISISAWTIVAFVMGRA